MGDTEKLNVGKFRWFCIPKNKDVKKNPNLAGFRASPKRHDILKFPKLYI